MKFLIDKGANVDTKDDGAGINAEQLQKVAVERNVISQEEAENLTDREVVNLIFVPGISTSQPKNFICKPFKLQEIFLAIHCHSCLERRRAPGRKSE